MRDEKIPKWTLNLPVAVVALSPINPCCYIYVCTVYRKYALQMQVRVYIKRAANAINRYHIVHFLTSFPGTPRLPGSPASPDVPFSPG